MFKLYKSAISLAVLAATGKMYGRNYPFTIKDIPAGSQLRKRLEFLPAQAKARGLQWLHSFDFPASDTNYLKLDNTGGVFYVDSGLTEGVLQTSTSTTPTTAAIDPANIFNLHSRPGASKVVFLDFDGHTVAGTAWNTSSGVSSYTALPFDLDSNPSSFSTDESNRIAEIWHRVAEDYAPFDIDVTAQEPAAFGPTVGRLLSTRSTDANGVAMPSQSAGGVAYINVFGSSNYVTTYSPAFVYFDHLGSGSATYVAEAASHEFGHNLGLSHDGVVDGTLNPNCSGTTGYFCGLGSGYTSWAPIMGVGYYTIDTALRSFKRHI